MPDDAGIQRHNQALHGFLRHHQVSHDIHELIVRPHVRGLSLLIVAELLEAFGKIFQVSPGDEPSRGEVNRKF